MNIKYTKHAKANLIDREIPRKLVEDTLKQPQQIVEGYGEKKIAQSIYKRNDKHFLLRVVYTKEAQAKKVVTAYWTSKIEKYWEGTQ